MESVWLDGMADRLTSQRQVQPAPNFPHLTATPRLPASSPLALPAGVILVALTFITASLIPMLSSTKAKAFGPFTPSVSRVGASWAGGCLSLPDALRLSPARLFMRENRVDSCTKRCATPYGSTDQQAALVPAPCRTAILPP